MELNKLTEKIIGCAYTVSNTLGAGFLEKVYENALAHELKLNKVEFDQQHPVKVLYDGVVVGDFVADLVVENQVIVELKAVRTIDNNHEAQLMNYLRASNIRTGLILNFGNPRLEIKRMLNGYEE